MLVNIGLFSFSHLFFFLHIPLLTKSGCVSQAVLYIIYNMKYKYVMYFIFSSPTQPFLSADIGGVHFYSCFLSITKFIDSKAIQICTPELARTCVFIFLENSHRNLIARPFWNSMVDFISKANQFSKELVPFYIYPTVPFDFSPGPYIVHNFVLLLSQWVWDSISWWVSFMFF